MKRPNRRQFVKAVAASAAAPALGLAPELVVAGDEPKRADTSRDVARALAEVVRARHGKRLDAALVQRVRLRIGGSLRSAQALDGVPLSNGDEPDFVFFAEEPQ